MQRSEPKLPTSLIPQNPKHTNYIKLKRKKKKPKNFNFQESIFTRTDTAIHAWPKKKNNKKKKNHN